MFRSANCTGQVLEKSVQKIQKLKNASYTEFLKSKFSFQESADIDTIAAQISIDPTEAQIGGYYKLTGKNDVDYFDGDKQIELNLRDTTYKIGKNAITSQNTRNLLYWINEIRTFLKTPAQIKQLNDTIIDEKAYYQFLYTQPNTINQNKKTYSFTYIIIDKQTMLPYAFKLDALGTIDDGTLMGLTEEHTYSAYKLNQTNFPNLTDATVPSNFKLYVSAKRPAPLPPGTKAPALKLSDMQGNRFDIEKLKGKVVLIDFTGIGCPHCANAVGMLNNLNKKYKGLGLEIVSVYSLESNKKEAITKFDKRFAVTYPSYTIEKDAKEYHLQGVPDFYLVDRTGTITKHYEGFYAELEQQLIAKIEDIK